MRTEQEMFDLILGTARNDDRIRAVIMNGSRTNPNAPKDIFQDYDIVYVVTETESFIKDKKWIDVFGKLVIIQLVDEVDKAVGHKVQFENRYVYLMQFADGNRIDLTLKTYDLAVKEMKSDKLTIVLLDKDGNLPKVTAATDEDYWVKRPDQDLYRACCNEYWWVMLYTAKGLWRDEILYSLEFLNSYVRPQLLKMISWYVGIQTDISCSIGKCGKYLNKYLPDGIWKRYLQTYPTADINSVWETVSAMNELFEEIAIKVGEKLGFSYNYEEAQNSRSFAEHVRYLPKDAEGIF